MLFYMRGEGFDTTRFIMINPLMSEIRVRRVYYIAI